MFSFSLLNTNWQNEILVNETNNLNIPYFLCIFYDKKNHRSQWKTKQKSYTNPNQLNWHGKLWKQNKNK